AVSVAGPARDGVHDRTGDHRAPRAPRRADLGDAGPLPRTQPRRGQEAHVARRGQGAGDARALPVHRADLMVARIALLAVAAALVVLAAPRLHDYTTCTAAGSVLFGQGLYAAHQIGTPVAGDPATAAAQMLDHCDDADILAAGAAVLVEAKHVALA